MAKDPYYDAVTLLVDFKYSFVQTIKKINKDYLTPSDELFKDYEEKGVFSNARVMHIYLTTKTPEAKKLIESILTLGTIVEKTKSNRSLQELDLDEIKFLINSPDKAIQEFVKEYRDQLPAAFMQPETSLKNPFPR